MNAQNFFWAGNIKFLRNRRKISQDELAEKLGISRSKLNAHENGQSRNPTVEDLVRFSDFFHFSIDSLLRVQLSGLSELKLRELEAGNELYTSGSRIRVLATTVAADNEENVELVPVKAKAGYTSGYGDPEFIATLPVFRMPQLPRHRKYRMFPVSGDSMLPVPDGAFVIASYAEDWQSLKSGTPCIVVTKEEGIVFKILHNHIREKQVLLLESLNTRYAPYEVAVRDVLEVWEFRSYLSDVLPDAEVPLQELARTVQEMRLDLKKLLKGQ